jgi:hypothetical protein
MTKKELYKLSVKVSGGTLQKYFGAPSQNFANMESEPGRKAARKHVYELLAPLLLDPEPTHVPVNMEDKKG